LFRENKRINGRGRRDKRGKEILNEEGRNQERSEERQMREKRGEKN